MVLATSFLKAAIIVSTDEVPFPRIDTDAFKNKADYDNLRTVVSVRRNKANLNSDNLKGFFYLDSTAVTQENPKVKAFSNSVALDYTDV